MAEKEDDGAWAQNHGDTTWWVRHPTPRDAQMGSPDLQNHPIVISLRLLPIGY